MRTSIFEIFRIGIGPSSSHTVGPMRAARTFVSGLAERSQLTRTAGVRVELYGSLALTGKGHGTDRAVRLGLMGETPVDVDVERIDAILAEGRERDRIRLDGVCDTPYSSILIVFHTDLVLPGHPNGMRFTAFDGAGGVLACRTFYSVGGGFVVEEGAPAAAELAPARFRIRFGPRPSCWRSAMTRASPSGRSCSRTRRRSAMKPRFGRGSAGSGRS